MDNKPNPLRPQKILFDGHSEFTELLVNVMEYYEFVDNYSEGSEDGETWKKDAGLISTGPVPKIIHDKIEKYITIELDRQMRLKLK